MARPLLLLIVAIAILIASYFQGWLHLINDGDSTHIVWGEGILFGIGLVLACFQKWKDVNWIANALVNIGLIGTVVGFIIALSGVIPDAANDIEQLKPMLVTLLKGAGIALYTTLVGAIGSLYLKFMRHVCINK